MIWGAYEIKTARNNSVRNIFNAKYNQITVITVDIEPLCSSNQAYVTILTCDVIVCTFVHDVCIHNYDKHLLYRGNILLSRLGMTVSEVSVGRLMAPFNHLLCHER